MSTLRGDITNHRLLVVKGMLFVVLGVLASSSLIGSAALGVPMGWWRVLLLHGVAVWSFCRAYYFAFYVIERYIDRGARYAGIASAARDAARILRAKPISRSTGGGEGP